jgi:hypothetical protein
MKWSLEFSVAVSHNTIVLKTIPPITDKEYVRTRRATVTDPVGFCRFQLGYELV